MGPASPGTAMRPTSNDIVWTLMSAQALVTAFLAVFLWSLHARTRQREFIRWWAWAWTFTTLYLGAGRIAIEFGRAWSAPKLIVVFVTTISGFLVVPSLIFGALSFRSPGTISRRTARNWLIAVVLFANLCVAVSLVWSHDRLTSFAVRNGTRELGLTLALFVSAWVFMQRGRATRSWAALVTGVSCLAYGMDQMLYTAVRLVDSPGRRPVPRRVTPVGPSSRAACSPISTSPSPAACVSEWDSC